MNETAQLEVEYDDVLRLFGARTGLVFRPDQRETTRQAVRRAMDSLGLESLDDYRRLLEHDDRALDELIIKLTIPETYFFREPTQFDYIRGEILPEFRKRYGADRTLRIWSAGCASGEEAYSLAMLCTHEGLAGKTHILATDISRVALGKAGAGSYGEWSLRGDRAAAARRHLRSRDGRYHIDPQIRRLVQFEFLNLALDVYPSFVTGTVGLDLILCRNVLIYFDRETVHEVARRLYNSLAPGGWLITASGDPSVERCAAYETVVTDAGIFYRRPLQKTATPVMEPKQSNGQWVPLDEAASETMSESFRPDETVSHRPVAVTTPVSPAPTVDALAAASTALLRGDYRGSVRITEGHVDDPDACVLHIKALANVDTQQALKASDSAVQRHPLLPELHYLHTALLMEVNRDAEAAQAARRAVFLDPSLAIAHFTLGAILQRRGDLKDALRCFRNARDLCEARPPDEIVLLTDGEMASQLAKAADVQLNTIRAAIGRRS